MLSSQNLEKKQKTWYRYGDEKMSEYKKKIIELIESNLTGYEISKKLEFLNTYFHN